MENYSTTIKETSREISAKGRVALKDTSNAIKLDIVVTEDGKLVIDVDMYAVLSVHNEKAEDKDYEQYIVIDKGGTKYVTGSQSFWNAFKSIVDEMNGTDEQYAIEVYKMESKNYKGKQFLTCSII